MSLISVYFIIFMLSINLLYYLTNIKFRNAILLLGSLFFVWTNSQYGILWMLFAIILSYAYGIGINRHIGFLNSRIGFLLTICALIFPLCFLKYSDGFQAPLGISYYTLSLISYVVDVREKKYAGEEKFSNFLLFGICFPYVVQGPIARYNSIAPQLIRKKKFQYQQFTYGWQLILWGYFLKFIIADKAGIIVDAVYDNLDELKGFYVIVAVLLYSIQLYADFMGCVNIAIGVAQTFGIDLQQNFKQPYFANSIGDFWRRWHITLSSWLRDYIYIPLGGSRNGVIRQSLNFIIVFAISGVWHGVGWTFLIWGLLHATYQIMGKMFDSWFPNLKDRVPQCIRIIFTFILVTFAWIFFRSNSIVQAFEVMASMFKVWNPGILFNDEAFGLMGISRLQAVPLVVGIMIMFFVDVLHIKGVKIRDYIATKSMVERWIFFILAIVVVLIFGTYGPGYASSQFIYGAF